MSTDGPSTEPRSSRRRRWLIAGGIALVTLLVVSATAWFAANLVGAVRLMDTGRRSGPVGQVAQPTVTKVVDGDTIEVRVGGRTEKVRLIGIDTPETKDPRRPVQCYGAEASAHTAELLPPGTAVRLERDVEERDAYDRLLAYVYRSSDDLFVNLELARDGYADLLTFPPNVAHTTELRAAVDEARRGQRGLWAACGGPGHPA
jgi:micrococcal nuclease